MEPSNKSRGESTVNVTDTLYSRNQKWIVLFLLVLSYPLFFYKLGARDIWEPNEDEYVVVNREMVLDGHWIYPTVNGRPHSIKPPLFNWIGSIFSVVNGEVTELTSRLPSAIAAAAGMLLVYFLGQMLFGHRAGLLSALIVGTTPLYIQFGRWIQNMPFNVRKFTSDAMKVFDLTPGDMRRAIQDIRSNVKMRDNNCQGNE